MKLTYFGTAAAEGWPGIFCHCEYCKRAKELGGKNIRTRSQALLDDTILFDLGPDTYLHMLRDGLDMPGIRHILITHTHEDHFYPKELLYRSEGFANEVTDPLTLYGSDAMVSRMADCFGEPAGEGKMLPGKITCREIEAFVPALIAGYTVTAMQANHDKSERCYIYLAEKDGRALLYGNDTGIFPEATWEFLEGKKLSLVSLDCTTGRFDRRNNHMGVPNVIEVRERLIRMNSADESTRFVATHFSHNGQMMHEDLEKAFEPHGILTAWDGMSVEV